MSIVFVRAVAGGRQQKGGSLQGRGKRTIVRGTGVRPRSGRTPVGLEVFKVGIIIHMDQLLRADLIGPGDGLGLFREGCFDMG